MTPQPGLLEAPSPARYFLELQFREGSEPKQVLAALAPGADTLVGFGPEWAERYCPGVVLTGFADLVGSRHTAPGTQADLFLAIHGGRHDDVFDRVLEIQRANRGEAEVALEVRGFDFHGSRDLIGFEDGTGNPKDEKAVAAAVIPDGAPGAGGSFAMTQRWQHDLPAFESLEVAEQERVIGRTKADSIEFEGDAMPSDSHVSRTDVSAAKILRRSSPYGDASSHGLYFLAFACEQARFRVQLERMYGLAEDGLADRLLEFSRAVTGSYWFVPSREDLARILAS